MIDGLGSFGIWRSAGELTPDLAATIEELGYGAIWIGSSPGGRLQIAEDLLAATSTITVATGITNIWADEPQPIAAAYHRIADRFPDRFLLGLGIGHPEATGERYAKPYSAMVEYLDVLDAEGVPAERRVLAALGPKTLRLAADRAAGAHPYLTTPEHTRRARELLGAGPLIAPEQKIVLDADPVRARAIGRGKVDHPYLHLTNYRSMLQSLGYTEADMADGGTDTLIDALVEHGDVATVAAALHGHLEAGADHVAVQLLTEAGDDPVPGFTALAAALELGATP